MSRVCQITGKRPMTGNTVSHANNRRRRRFLPNLHVQRFWLESERRFVSLRVSTRGLRTIEKKGIETQFAAVLQQTTATTAKLTTLRQELSADIARHAAANGRTVARLDEALQALDGKSDAAVPARAGRGDAPRRGRPLLSRRRPPRIPGMTRPRKVISPVIAK